jgi:hypothetical protein
MSQKSTETPNQKPDWLKVLEEQGLFKYHEFVVQGMRITEDGRILGCSILDTPENRKVLEEKDE